MAEMKGIKLCGECGNYDWKKHKCKIGCNDDSNAQASFYGDCPLPDVVPKSEVEKIFEEIEKYAQNQIEGIVLAETIKPEAIPFFAGGKLSFELLLDRLAELKKKYTEGKDEKGSN